MTLMAQITPVAERRVKFTRVLAAPRRVIFAQWTDQRQMAQWWGPRGFTNPVCELDARPGGTIRIHMRAPDGTQHVMTGMFHEVRAPERLALTVSAEEAGGRRLLEVDVRLMLDEHAGITALVLEVRAVGLSAAGARLIEGMEPGWSQSLERLAALAAARADNSVVVQGELTWNRTASYPARNG
jgi:uncharacterized protein YndB with AHSA1/START domain